MSKGAQSVPDSVLNQDSHAVVSSTSSQSSMPLMKFTVFNLLPTELRIRVWNFVPTEPRLIEMMVCPDSDSKMGLRSTRGPATLRATVESRAEALKNYEAFHFESSSAMINWKQDIVHIWPGKVKYVLPQRMKQSLAGLHQKCQFLAMHMPMICGSRDTIGRQELFDLFPPFKVLEKVVFFWQVGRVHTHTFDLSSAYDKDPIVYESAEDRLLKGYMRSDRALLQTIREDKGRGT